jgi:hypothetical protein
MSFNKQVLFSRGLTMLSFFCAFILAANIYAGCGGNSDEASPGAILAVAETVIAPDDGTLVVDSDDSYYIALEKKLNDELDVNRAPDKCAAQGLTKIVLNFTTDEIQTCSTYDLSKLTATAYFSDKTDEVITPAWSIYSGGGTLDGTTYTATNKPAIIVFKAIYSENGISKLALFRLTVTGLISISLNKTTDEIQLPATYDLSTELLIKAKLSNGTTKAIVKGDPNLKWTLASGAGTITDGIYTPSAKVETATFTANYTENGVAKAAQFKLKVTGLSSLILSKTTDEVNSCETYDLASKIIVSNKLSNGSINDITSSQNLNWTLSSGSGILDSKVYTAPAKAETAVFTASYTEAGITKTAQFRLKVTGLSSVVLDKTTDEIMLPATYDLAFEINATVKFSDGESKSVDLIWTLYSGSGVLSGSIYTPAAKTETAVFIGSYTENGITKTAQFKLKVTGLSSLTLSKTTDEVVSCATYDLSQIVVSDKLSNGTVNNITNSTFWKLITGFGTLSGTTYTAPARAETAAFTANYTEAGITKTVQFRLKVIALASIKLSKTTDEAQILAQYDLASNIAVTAKLSNGQTKSISGNDPNLKWTLSYGSGILSGTLYTPPERIETAVLTATYTENGVAQSAQLRLKSSATLRGKIELVGLTLAQTTDSVRIGQTYDLSKLIAIAKFADKTTAEVSLSWIVSSGGGFISGTIYTAPNNVATVKLMGTFTALDGSARSVYFTLTIYGNEIYGNRGMVTMEGAKFYLTNGITVEIPPNSVKETFELAFELDKSFGDFKSFYGQTNFSCNFINEVEKIVLKKNVDTWATAEDISLTCIMPDVHEVIFPEAAIENSSAVFKIGLNSELNSPISYSSDPQIEKALKGRTTFSFYYNIKSDQLKFGDTLYSGKTLYDPISWPYYRQYENSCYATTLLMLIKGYKEPDNSFDSIYKIINELLKNNVIISNDGSAYSARLKTSRDGSRIRLFIDLEEFIFNYGIAEIPDLINQHCRLIASAYYCNNVHALFNLIAEVVSKKRLLKVETLTHSILVCGYKLEDGAFNFNASQKKYEYNHKLIYIYYYDPAEKSSKYKTMSLDQLATRSIQISDSQGQPLTMPLDYYTPYICYAIDNSIKSPQKLQTIHMPVETAGRIEFINENQIAFLTSFWNLKLNIVDDNYNKTSFIDWINNKSVSQKLKDIKYTNIPIYNSDSNPKKVYVKSSILTKSNNLLASASSLKDGTNIKDFQISISDVGEYKFSNEKLVENFNNKLNELKITTENEYILLVELKDSNTNTSLDKFDLKFKYVPSSGMTGFLIPDKPIMDFNDSNRLYLKYGMDKDSAVDVSGLALWSAPAGVFETTETTCYYKPTKPGVYTITATLLKGTLLPDNTTAEETITVTFEITVNGVIMVPLAHNMYSNETKQFSLFYGTGEASSEVTTSAAWRVIKPIQSSAPKMSPGMPDRASGLPDPSAVFGLFTPVGNHGTFEVEATYNGLAATAKVTVNPRELNIEPSPASVSINMQRRFSAFADGTLLDKDMIWSSLFGGSIDQTGIYTAPGQPGTYTVSAKYLSLETSAVVLVKTLYLTPTSREIKAKETLKFSLKYGISEQSTTEEVSSLAQWSVLPNVGNITNGLYTPAGAGTFEVAAEYAGVKVTAEVKVLQSELKITPATATLIYGQQQEFKALVDNETAETNIVWSVEDPNGGSIDSTAGQYTAPNNAGTYIVKALYSGIEATAEVTVQAPVLKVTPATVTLYTKDTQQFALLVNDKTQETEIQWTTTGGAVGSSDGSYMAPDHAGTYIVTATFRTVAATAEVIVKEHEIKIVPPAAETNIGQSVQFTAFVDNATAETGVSWSTDVMGGRVDQTGLYTAPGLPGVHRVTAKYLGVETSAEVTVNGLFLAPLTHQMRFDETFQFSLKYGANESTTTEVNAQALWKVIPEIGSITNGLYDPSEIGNFEITAEYNGMIVTAEVTVTAADLKISPPSAVLNRSQQMTFKALVGDTTQETGIVWSVVSLNGGSITQTGVYTAPAQWGKYVIKAAYQGIEATAEVRVNDERVQLTKDNVFLSVYGNPMKADGTPLNSSSSSTSFNVKVSGIDVSTVEISIAEGENLGRFVYYHRTYPVSGYPVNVTYYYYFYYTQNSTQPYYDTNEIIHLNVKCPDNSNASVVIPVTVYQPQLSDTIETDDGSRLWRFKKIGYRNDAGVWSDSISYKSSYNFFHGPRSGTWKDNNLVGYVQNFYCGEGSGEHRFYYHSVGDVRNGLLYTKCVFADNLLSYDSSGWAYYSEWRVINGQYVSVNYTEKVVEKFTRTSINLGWTSVPGSRIITKYDGWSAQ